MQRFDYPLGPSPGDVAPRFAEPGATYGEPLAAVLEPLPVYREPAASFGDALAVTRTAEDPLAAPLLASTAAVAADLGPAVGDPPAMLPEATPVEPPSPEPVRSTAEPDDALDPPTLRTAMLPPLGGASPGGRSGGPSSGGVALAPPAAGGPQPPAPAGGGRISAGIPRGWSPPMVPPNRGWSEEVPLPPPEPPPRRRARPAAPAPAPSLDARFDQLPPGVADTLARLQTGRAGTGRRGRGGRLIVLLLLAVLLVQAAAARNWPVTAALVVLAAVNVLTLLWPLARRQAERPTQFFRPPAG